jgi:hypothetical protein
MLVNGTRTTYSKSQVMDATTTSLIHRGNGTGPDADSGWEKMCTPVSPRCRFRGDIHPSSQGAQRLGHNSKMPRSFITN